MLWIHLEEGSSWNGTHYSNNANRLGWAGAGGPNLVYKEDTWQGMEGLLRGKQVALVSWVGALLSWGGEQQQHKCWDWQEKLVEVLSYVSGHSCSEVLCRAWILSAAELAAGELQSQAGKVVHSELHFSSNIVKWSGCLISGLQGFQEFGMKLNNLGTFSDEEYRSSCWTAWQWDVARPPSFPSVPFVTCCAWLCLRAVKAINSHSPLFNSVQRNIGAGPSEMCQAAPRVMALGIRSVGYNFCLGCSLLSCATFSLKVPTPFCFVLPRTTRVQWSVSSCIGKHILEGREMLLPYQQIISHRLFIYLLQRT